MGPNEIAALQSMSPKWAPFIVMAAILVPVVIALLNRERKKPADPVAGILTTIRALEKRLDEVEDDTRDIRRDVDKMERRQDLFQAIREMGRHHE